MVPAEFVTYFSVMAGVGGTLFGLIFLVISIKPEIVRAENESVMRQVQVASSYSALLNPLVISLIAIVPHATVGLVTLIMSATGLINTLIMGSSLLRESVNQLKKLRSLFFILGSVVIFGLEFYYGLNLEIAPRNLDFLYNLTTLLVIIYLYGVARAWDLVGLRQFHLQEVLTPLVPKDLEKVISGTSHAEPVKDVPRQQD